MHILWYTSIYSNPKAQSVSVITGDNFSFEDKTRVDFRLIYIYGLPFIIIIAYTRTHNIVVVWSNWGTMCSQSKIALTLNTKTIWTFHCFFLQMIWSIWSHCQFVLPTIYGKRYRRWYAYIYNIYWLSLS